MNSELLFDRCKKFCTSISDEVQWFKNNIKDKKEQEIISLYINAINVHCDFENIKTTKVWHLLVAVTKIKPFPPNENVTTIILSFIDNMRDKIDRDDYLYFALSLGNVFSFTYEKLDSIYTFDYFFREYGTKGCCNVVSKVLSECDDVDETITAMLKCKNVYMVIECTSMSGYIEGHFHLFFQSDIVKQNFFYYYDDYLGKLTFDLYEKISPFISDEEIFGFTEDRWYFSQKIKVVDDKVLNFINKFICKNEIISICLSSLDNPRDLFGFFHLIDGINGIEHQIELDDIDIIDILLSLGIDYKISTKSEEVVNVFFSMGLIDKVKLYGDHIFFFSEQLAEKILMEKDVLGANFMTLLDMCDSSEQKLIDVFTKMRKILEVTGKKMIIYSLDAVTKLHMVRLHKIIDNDVFINHHQSYLSVAYKKIGADPIKNDINSIFYRFFVNYDDNYMIKSVLHFGNSITICESGCIFENHIDPSEYETLLELQGKNPQKSLFDLTN